jgi:hypothetical protein
MVFRAAKARLKSARAGSASVPLIGTISGRAAGSRDKL